MKKKKTYHPEPIKVKSVLVVVKAMAMAKPVVEGTKRAGARSGYSLRAGFEGGQMPLFRKLPQRGFNQKRFQTPHSVVNLSDLSKINGEKVDMESLKQAGLIRPNSKRIKLLGTGEVDKAYQVQVTFYSRSAKKKSKLPEDHS